jgi:hypothetical protein
VTVKTIDPRIITGQAFLPTPPHFVRKTKTIDVEPSTIEEFSILLEIGKLLGETGMPNLKKPNLDI